MKNEFEQWMLNLVKARELRKEILKMEADQERVESLADETHDDAELEEAFIGLDNTYTQRIKALKYRLAKIELEIAKFEYEDSIRD